MFLRVKRFLSFCRLTIFFCLKKSAPAGAKNISYFFKKRFDRAISIGYNIIVSNTAIQEKKMVFPVKTCVIIRGLSGSGKSTLARQIVNNHKDYTCSIHETDSFFYDEDGKYKVDTSKFREFHKKNFENFSESIENNTWVVINSNTNTQLWEFNNYLDKALEHGYATMIIDLYDAGMTNDELHKRQVHDFPIEKYEVARHYYERSYANLDPRHPFERGDS